MKTIANLFLLFVTTSSGGAAASAAVHVWEKVELAFKAQNAYTNPYTQVQVWVDLKGPGFEKRCYGFWDGGDTFRARVLATRPGTWSWESGSNQEDADLNKQRGAFTAIVWSEADKAANPCRRGMIQATPNGHAFQYADGTPFFLVGDTWWATPTFRYRWHDDEQPRPLGPTAGFKDFVAYRKQQEYNCIAMIAALPAWANDGQPNNIDLADGTVVRSAWRQAGTSSAKDMHNEAGERPFEFPGRIPGYERIFPDLERLNPAYFRSLDQKVDYLNAAGFIPFIEVARRDLGQAWKKFHPWPGSYTRYIQYVWSRYQANLCLFSPIHFDTPAKSIPAADWNVAANQVIADYGAPPFGTLAGPNSNPSSLENFGHVDKARWLGFHQLGNRRTHDCYGYLTDIFKAQPPVPAINGEPYYDGMEKAEPGSELAALYCRSAMYGSVLSGGLGGHIYGAGGWEGGLWSGEVEAASKYPIWKVLQWPSADQMRHLKTFILSEGARYQELIPANELLEPNKSSGPRTLVGWAYCARAPKADLFLVYFEKDCRTPVILKGARPSSSYSSQWFDPRTGQWTDAANNLLKSDAQGLIALPPFPSANDWALKLKLR